MELELIVRVTDHAYEQYCQRVGRIERAELRNLLTSEIQEKNYRKEREYVHIDGVWWVCEIVSDVMIMITCYGKSDFDMPRALKWARVHDDRIRLDPEYMTK